MRRFLSELFLLTFAAVFLGVVISAACVSNSDSGASALPAKSGERRGPSPAQVVRAFGQDPAAVLGEDN
jgi:hypothetical protein